MKLDNLQKIDSRIDELTTDNEELKKFKKMFGQFSIDLPVNVKKKIESREKKNNTEICELMRKRDRVSNETKSNIENNL